MWAGFGYGYARYTGSQVDVLRCGTDMAPTIGMNLDIGNVAWYDYKEEEEEAFGGFAGKDINVMLEQRQQSQKPDIQRES